MAPCGMDCIDLTEDVIKIVKILVKLEQEKNFLNYVVKIQNILKLCKLGNLTIGGRNVIFKPFAILKLVHPSGFSH